MSDPPPRGSQDMSELETQTKRSWFRFHLLTAVVAMICSAILLLSNFRKRETKELIQETDGAFIEEQYGWPLVAYRTVSDELADATRAMQEQIRSHSVSTARPYPRVPNELSRRGLICDVFIAFGILVAVAFASEWLIRRREARKT
jgi:hypothetical protein